MADDGSVQITEVRKSIDFATIVGVIAAFALVAAAVILGGSPSTFFNLPALLIVLGGTFAITTVCFSFSEMMRAIKVVSKTLLHSTRDSDEATLQVIQIAQLAR